MHLVIGKKSQIGSELISQLSNRVEVVGTERRDPAHPLRSTLDQVFVDLKTDDIVSAIETFKPEVLWLPAGPTNVDEVETSPTAYQEMVGYLKATVQVCKSLKTKIVYFSSDYVFDGIKNNLEPYSLFDITNPINKYGQFKLAAEHYLLSQNCNALVIRTNCVFSKKESSFVSRLINNLKTEKSVYIPYDEWVTPTHVTPLVEMLIHMVTMPVSDPATHFNGIVHVAGPEHLNKYSFALKIAKSNGLDQSKIIPVPSINLKRAAMRPLKAGLKTQSLEYILSKTFFNPLEDYLKL